MIASGLRVDGPQRVTVFVAEAVGAAPVFANLADNGEMAVTLSNVLDHRSIQLKGRRLADGPASEADRAFQAQYMERLRPALTLVGMPRSIAARAGLVAQPGHPDGRPRDVRADAGGERRTAAGERAADRCCEPTHEAAR